MVEHRGRRGQGVLGERKNVVVPVPVLLTGLWSRKGWQKRGFGV